MKKRTFVIAAFGVIALASCIKNEGVDTPRAGILIDLLSPDATYTAISLNGNTIGSNVSYGSVPKYYNQVPAGAANISVFNSASAELLKKSFTTEAGQFYSAFLVDSASRMKSIVVKDSVGYPNTADSVKVRFYNFAPNSIPLSVRVYDSATIWADRPFETQESAIGRNTFIGMKAGSYRFQVFTPFNTAEPLKDTSIVLEGKHIYTLFIKGFYPDTTGTTAIGLGIVKHG